MYNIVLLKDEASGSGMDCDQDETVPKSNSKKEYDCVICNQTSPSTEDKPMGLVILIQVSFMLCLFSTCYNSSLR